MHVLFEHASGYALFRVKEFEEVGLLQPEVEESVTDLSRFNTIVKLQAFSPFKSGTNALDNINSISEGRFTLFAYDLHNNTMTRKTTVDTVIIIAHVIIATPHILQYVL